MGSEEGGKAIRGKTRKGEICQTKVGEMKSTKNSPLFDVLI